MIYENEPIHTIKLYGSLRKKFGKEYHLSGHSAAAAIRGLALQIPEFGQILVKGFFRVLRGENLKSAQEYKEEEIGAEIGSQAQVFHIIPVAAGAKGGIFNVIAGAFIMVAACVGAFFTGGATLSAAAAQFGLSTSFSFGTTMAVGFASSAFLGISYGTIAMFGLGLTLIGVSQMTAKTPKTDYSREEDNSSSVLSGPTNTATQGAAVPLAYGKIMVGSILVASNLTAIDYSVDGWRDLIMGKIQ